MTKIAVDHLYCTKLFALDDYYYFAMFVLLCLFCSFCLFLGRPRALSQTGIDWIMPIGKWRCKLQSVRSLPYMYT